MRTHSQRLRDRIAMVNDGLTIAARRVWMHPRMDELYPEFLYTVHAITRATAPSMTMAADRAKELIGTDPVALPLHEYLAEHAVEETGHDLWTLDDLSVLGHAPEKVLNRIPSPAVASLVGSQYYWLNHVHPVAYLSYVAVLEGPQTVEFLHSVMDRAGLPEAAFSTHLIHAKLDIHHVKAFEEFLDGLPLSARHQEILGVNAIATVALLQQVFEEVLERFERTSASTAARLTYPELAVTA